MGPIRFGGHPAGDQPLTSDARQTGPSPLLHLYRWQGYRVDLTDGSTGTVRIEGGEPPGEGEPYAAW
ncbi:hypothetical protein HS048_24140 [Planomonospora sp. ID91781]|uniref:hypothetical protein n=1 Tax=Planomonospora sp. ID91781 TaxID=2738135 RepID=UPI0018C3FF6F|nr:hypothetical protein [Planomonospora sp. ID91781]MBG0823815.1 hypothetical protein [Planomonospora sp. ID91781]